MKDIASPAPDTTSGTLRPNFLDIPVEIRSIVYYDALVEPPRWRKSHKPPCPFTPRSANVIERPPFVMHRGPQCVNYMPGCSCAKRHSLSLLLVSRQVHAEAAPIFWSQNTFHFCTGHMFARNIGQQLRDDYRKLLRHVVVMRHPKLQNIFTHGQDQSGIGFDSFWDALFQCEGLATLETPRNVFCRNDQPWDAYVHHLQVLSNRLPKLESFRICMLEVYNYRDVEIAGFVYDHEEAEALFWRMWVDLPFLEYRTKTVTEVEAVVWTLRLGFLHKFRSRVARALARQFHVPPTGHNWRRLRSTAVFYRYPMEHILQFVDSPTVTIRLPSDRESSTDDPWITKMSGEIEAELEVMGLPITRRRLE